MRANASKRLATESSLSPKYHKIYLVLRQKIEEKVTRDEFDTFMSILKEGSLLSSVDDIQYVIIDDAKFTTDGFEIR